MMRSRAFLIVISFRSSWSSVHGASVLRSKSSSRETSFRRAMLFREVLREKRRRLGGRLVSKNGAQYLSPRFVRGAMTVWMHSFKRSIQADGADHLWASRDRGGAAGGRIIEEWFWGGACP